MRQVLPYRIMFEAEAPDKYSHFNGVYPITEYQVPKGAIILGAKAQYDFETFWDSSSDRSLS